MATPAYPDEAHLAFFADRIRLAEDDLHQLKQLSVNERIMVSKWLDMEPSHGHERAMRCLRAFETLSEVRS